MTDLYIYVKDDSSGASALYRPYDQESLRVIIEPDCSLDLPSLDEVNTGIWPMNWQNRLGN